MDIFPNHLLLALINPIAQFELDFCCAGMTSVILAVSPLLQLRETSEIAYMKEFSKRWYYLYVGCFDL